MYVDKGVKAMLRKYDRWRICLIVGCADRKMEGADGDWRVLQGQKDEVPRTAPGLASGWNDL
jgi:hypothetical protein